jgi:hypothetical protein
MIKNFNGLLIVIICIIFSCNTKKPSANTVDNTFQLLDTDRSFSKLSEQKGIKFALIQFIDNKGVFLRPGTFPLIGG